eukprot:6175436-Pleurochrysis_carterae.AAC.3
MGHWQAFTAICAEGGNAKISPQDPIECIRSAAVFYVVPIVTDVKTMINLGLRAILDLVLEVVVFATRSRLAYVFWDIMA